MMLPRAEIDVTSPVSNETQASDLMKAQGDAIREYFGEIGPAALHEAATVEHAQRRAAVQERADEAEERHQRSRDAQHRDSGRSAE